MIDLKLKGCKLVLDAGNSLLNNFSPIKNSNGINTNQSNRNFKRLFEGQSSPTTVALVHPPTSAPQLVVKIQFTS